MTTLIIQLDASKNEDALIGFPFVAGQYIESETENDGIVHCYLADETDESDFTMAQELFLDGNPAVVKYDVK